MKKGLSLFFLLFSFILKSQSTSENEWGSWIMFYGDNHISEHLDIVTEFRLHQYEIYNALDNRFYKIGLGYQITPGVTVGAGYVHHYSETTTDINTSENRPYEEICIKSKIRKLGISHRYRMEHRWINKDGDTDFVNRMRYRLQLAHPICGKLYVKVFDEIFLDLDEDVFNQNRLHTGIGYHIDANFKFEVGYVKNHLSSRADDIFRVGILFNTDLRRKQDPTESSD
ncbi:DUF2490 domain-containing protein [Maribacter polysaccharolyticus]|uniref:DUF2490 domain-containing protein n=1 Tax=Maribacter polysaccharolyticus TaxID=3020831 RepID=UPI00237F7531|nr:DUF2490 domain-containing protein [Maribacter polysaccharolyticus]MDE3740780.1 DUF2490 domain-containing protein [Maribacter polysaccharolyticus]